MRKRKDTYDNSTRLHGVAPSSALHDRYTNCDSRLKISSQRACADQSAAGAPPSAHAHGSITTQTRRFPPCNTRATSLLLKTRQVERNWDIVATLDISNLLKDRVHLCSTVRSIVNPVVAEIHPSL